MKLLTRFLYKQRRFYDDDFDWQNYTSDSYQRRLEGDVESRHLARGRPGDLTFDPETGRVTSQREPLHPNAALILEVIGRLRPQSVHEVGCGGGDHVAHGALLFPETAFTGGDRSHAQLALALERHPELAGRVGVQDITMPFSEKWPKAELVYTQAVIMHIHTAVSHFVALANLVRQARTYVLLVENYQCHNFVEELLALHEGGHLPWEDLHLYLATGSSGARGILISRVELDWPELASDHALRSDDPPSRRRLKRASEDTTRATYGFPDIR